MSERRDWQEMNETHGEQGTNGSGAATGRRSGSSGNGTHGTVAWTWRSPDGHPQAFGGRYPERHRARVLWGALRDLERMSTIQHDLGYLLDTLREQDPGHGPDGEDAALIARLRGSMDELYHAVHQMLSQVLALAEDTGAAVEERLWLGQDGRMDDRTDERDERNGWMG